MSRSDERPAGTGLRHARIAVVAVVVPVLSSVVLAGLLDESGLMPATVTTTQASPAATAGTATVASTEIAYQLRCWQDGRLIFEENGLTAPLQSGRPVLAMQSREGGSDLHLIDTGNTACLIQQRSASDSRRLPLRP